MSPLPVLSETEKGSKGGGKRSSFSGEALRGGRNPLNSFRNRLKSEKGTALAGKGKKGGVQFQVPAEGGKKNWRERRASAWPNQ